MLQQPRVHGEDSGRRFSSDSGAAQCPDDEEIADRDAAGVGGRSHHKPANSTRHCDEPCPALRIDPGEEPIKPTVVERAVVIGKVPIRLRKVVPIQLAEVLQHSAVRTVERDEFNRLGWRARCESRRV
jgi:hypothetical protein